MLDRRRVDFIFIFDNGIHIDFIHWSTSIADRWRSSVHRLLLDFGDHHSFHCHRTISSFFLLICNFAIIRSCIDCRKVRTKRVANAPSSRQFATWERLERVVDALKLSFSQAGHLPHCCAPMILEDLSEAFSIIRLYFVEPMLDRRRVDFVSIMLSNIFFDCRDFGFGAVNRFKIRSQG